MTKGIRRKLDLVLRNIAYELRPQPDDNAYTRGLRGEGYLGGYRAAIIDVKIALDGFHPDTRDLWDNWEETRGIDYDRI